MYRRWYVCLWELWLTSGKGATVSTYYLFISTFQRFTFCIRAWTFSWKIEFRLNCNEIIAATMTMLFCSNAAAVDLDILLQLKGILFSWKCSLYLASSDIRCWSIFFLFFFVVIGSENYWNWRKNDYYHHLLRSFQNQMYFIRISYMADCRHITIDRESFQNIRSCCRYMLHCTVTYCWWNNYVFFRQRTYMHLIRCASYADNRIVISHTRFFFLGVMLFHQKINWKGKSTMTYMQTDNRLMHAFKPFVYTSNERHAHEQPYN